VTNTGLRTIFLARQVGNYFDCTPFDIQNLGVYERQRWLQVTGNGMLRRYLETILAFYGTDAAGYPGPAGSRCSWKPGDGGGSMNPTAHPG
jgi:hypothetical protein